MNHDQEILDDEQTRYLSDFKLWGRLLKFIVPQWKWVLTAVSLAFIITGASLMWPRLVQLAIDKYILNNSLPVNDRMNGVTWIAMLFLAVIVVGFVANFFQVIALEWAGQRIMHSLRLRLFNHVISLNLSFFSAHRVGRLVTRHTNDIQNMYEMFTSVIITLFNEGIRLVGILLVLFWMDWRLSLLLALSFPPMILITLTFGKLSRRAFRRIRSHLAGINAFLQEAVSGMSVVQIFLREKDVRERFSRLNGKYFEAAMYQIRVFGIFVPLIEVMSSVTLALIIWYGGGQVLRNFMTIGILTAFISYMRLFFQPIREFSQKYTIVQSAMTSAERIFQLLEEKDYIPQVIDPVRIDEIRGHIEFRGVVFSYETGRPVLRNISFEVKPGSTFAIIGATGSGKTTIINLLERFYDPQQGSVLLDGVDLRRFEPHWLREHIGLVMQDIFIVPGSIRENILLDRDLSEAEIGRIVGLSQLESLVHSLPRGLDTTIGEGGMDLSAGQKQLLAFARVLARDPKILILDEATSNVDTQTEMLIEQAIRAVMANRTSIIIAHRLSTIRRANQIIIIDQGRIVEQGTHEDLMEKAGLYHHLQTLENGISVA
ncbi:MAG TPA: ABC transporter ATP-binding protein [Deltaproteobacteria bacterium]|jgi:ATP-binding cassette subfamily B protein|nr:ABC transporter ATP-binding protein [Deltaproteobacteria bacterium]